MAMEFSKGSPNLGSVGQKHCPDFFEQPAPCLAAEERSSPPTRMCLDQVGDLVGVSAMRYRVMHRQQMR